MKVSIITVCFNSAKTIGDTLNSVAAQEYPDIEYIIVDGISKDTTWELIQEALPRLPHSTFCIRERDTGIYDAMNKGLAKASGDIIGFLNSDDVFADSSAIRRIVGGFAAKDTDLVYGDLVYTKENDLDQVTRRWKSGNMPFSRLKSGWHPAHPTMYVRRDLLKRQPFNLSYRIAADYELMVRLIEKLRVKSCYVPYVIVKMREGGLSNKGLKNILKANIECSRAWRDNGFFPSPFTIGFKLTRKILQYRKG
ncbi:MAG: glycosyltransferase [Flavobacterium sp.]|nr:MAG: glycosyltransferase [Flavobacterium sp.]